MIKISKKTKEKLICAALILVGLGICIGSIWFAPLVILGGSILGAGLNMAAGILRNNERIIINNYAPKRQEDAETSNKKAPFKTAYSFSKEKLGAIFAFGNTRYTKYHNTEVASNAPEQEQSADNIERQESAPLTKDMMRDLDKLNELLRDIDLAAIHKMAEKLDAVKTTGRHSENSNPS